jgi:hypothetical protein
MDEGVDTSYTKFHRDVAIDDNPYNLVVPPENQLYVGWTDPGEWFKVTIHILTNGNMNLAYFDFKERKPVDSNRAGEK